VIHFSCTHLAVSSLPDSNIPQKEVRKIAIAINITETGKMPIYKTITGCLLCKISDFWLGITIPDITAVVDTGKEKVMR
jgi:hypothetical protein